MSIRCLCSVSILPVLAVLVACASDTDDCPCLRCSECRDEGDSVWIVVRDTVAFNVALTPNAARAAAERSLEPLVRRKLAWCVEAMRLPDGRCVADAGDSTTTLALSRLVGEAAVETAVADGNAVCGVMRLRRAAVTACVAESRRGR